MLRINWHHIRSPRIAAVATYPIQTTNFQHVQAGELCNELLVKCILIKNLPLRPLSSVRYRPAGRRRRRVRRAKGRSQAGGKARRVRGPTGRLRSARLPGVLGVLGVLGAAGRRRRAGGVHRRLSVLLGRLRGAVRVQRRSALRRRRRAAVLLNWNYAM